MIKINLYFFKIILNLLIKKQCRVLSLNKIKIYLIFKIVKKVKILSIFKIFKIKIIRENSQFNKL